MPEFSAKKFFKILPRNKLNSMLNKFQGKIIKVSQCEILRQHTTAHDRVRWCGKFKEQTSFSIESTFQTQLLNDVIKSAFPWLFSIQCNKIDEKKLRTKRWFCQIECINIDVCYWKVGFHFEEFQIEISESYIGLNCRRVDINMPEKSWFEV